MNIKKNDNLIYFVPSSFQAVSAQHFQQLQEEAAQIRGEPISLQNSSSLVDAENLSSEELLSPNDQTEYQWNKDFYSTQTWIWKKYIN